MTDSKHLDFMISFKQLDFMTKFIETSKKHGRLIGFKGSRRESKELVICIQLSYSDWDVVFDGVETLKEVRRNCVKEREEWGAIKNGLKGPDAKFAKEEGKVWLQREKAATILINSTEGGCSVDTYDWPIELGLAFKYCIERAFMEQPNE